MDTAWLNGKVPADHYRHSRPAYYRALQQAHLIEPSAEPAESEQANKTVPPAPVENSTVKS
jgi:hypothetical protein